MNIKLLKLNSLSSTITTITQEEFTTLKTELKNLLTLPSELLVATPISTGDQSTSDIKNVEISNSNLVGNTVSTFFIFQPLGWLLSSIFQMLANFFNDLKNFFSF